MSAKSLLIALVAASAIAVASPRTSHAGAFTLTSPTHQEGGGLNERQVLDGFGCHGQNLSPPLSWSGAPAGAKSFAVTLYDPDAPTGSGWWHWVVFDIPRGVTSLAEGAQPPAPAIEGRNDFGAAGYGGACPPPGGPAHRYVFTVYALDTERLGVAADASPAMIGFNIHAHSLGEAKLTVRYSR